MFFIPPIGGTERTEKKCLQRDLGGAGLPLTLIVFGGYEQESKAAPFIIGISMIL